VAWGQRSWPCCWPSSWPTASGWPNSGWMQRSCPVLGMFCMFGCWDDPWAYTVELVGADSIIGLAVVIWLIAFAIRRASRSILTHPSFP
jgi:hypothetical protein